MRNLRLIELLSVLLGLSNLCFSSGVQEFTSSTVWQCPKGVHAIEVEMYGAGGGGGGAGSVTQDILNGQPGGGGAYVLHRLDVKPKKVYTIVVGSGGLAGMPGAGSGTPGADGTTSSISLNGEILLYAGAGKGGAAGTAPTLPNRGGEPDPRAGVGRRGGENREPYPNAIYRLGLYEVANGGQGGHFQVTSPDQYPFRGDNGYVLLKW